MSSHSPRLARGRARISDFFSATSVSNFERQCATQDGDGSSGAGAMCRPTGRLLPAGRKLDFGRPVDRSVDKIGSKRPHTMHPSLALKFIGTFVGIFFLPA